VAKLCERGSVLWPAMAHARRPDRSEVSRHDAPQVSVGRTIVHSATAS